MASFASLSQNLKFNLSLSVTSILWRVNDWKIKEYILYDKERPNLRAEWHKIEFSVYNISYVTQTGLKLRHPIFWWMMTKRCFRTQCNYQIQIKTCVIFGFLVIYTQYHSLIQPTRRTEYMLNYQISVLANCYYTHLSFYRQFFVTALILNAHNWSEKYFNWIIPSAFASFKLCGQPTEGVLCFSS